MDFKSVQKLRFFLATVFPVLAGKPRLNARTLAWIERRPRLRRRLDQVRDSPIGASVQRANELYITGNYGGENLDWKVIPPESTLLLRVGILLAGTLCLLVPLAMRWVWPALEQEPITGLPGDPVAGWSVVLWMVGAAAGWAALLIGSAAANRCALLPALALCLYFNMAMCAALPRSWWSLPLFFLSAYPIIFSEARAPERGWAGIWRSAFVGIIAGAMTGIVGIAITPMGARFTGHVVRAGIIFGVPLGLLLCGLGRLLARYVRTGSGPPPTWLRVDLAAAVVAGLHLVFTTALALRGGLTIPAQGLQPLAVQFTGYLWPLFYLIGVGVIFKMLRQTKLIHATVRELIPARILVPVGLLLLAAATAVSWCEGVTVQPGFPWPPGFMSAAFWIQGVTAWLWHQPLWGMTLEWMRWGFLGALVLAAWATVRRRLDSEGMAALLFATTLLCLATFEYFFEFSGFLRSPMHSATSLLAFAIFVLWLSHLALRSLLTGDSAWWPRPARVALYAAGLLFVLLPVHARAAMHDVKLTNEIFLSLFFGILDLGLPYYLYVYAERRFQRLPFTAARLVGLFGLGAALSVPFTILDKMAISGWSFGTVWGDAGAQIAAMLQGENVAAIAPYLPTGWILLRGLLAMAAIVTVGMIVGRRMAGRELAPAATIFAVVAIAAGLACFANRVLELPLLPNQIVQLITPVRVSHHIDATLVARYFSLVIPALVFGLVLTAKVRGFRRGAVIVAAAGAHLLTAWAWPGQEPWLRSTGVLALVGGAGVVGLLVLVVAVRDRLDAVLPRKENSAGPAPLLRSRELMIGGGVLIAALLVFAGMRGYSRRIVTREFFDPAVAIGLPAIWRGEAAATAPTVLLAPTYGSIPPVLSIGLRSADTTDMHAVLQVLASEGAEQLPGFSMTGLEKWDRYRPGALALEFQFERQVGAVTVPVFGTAVVAPLRADAALVFTVMYELNDRDLRWDVARALQSIAAGD